MKILQNFSLLSIALFITLLTGCGTAGDHDEHDETPVGLVLSVNETDIAMQEGKNVTYTTGTHIELSHGATLGPILVEFLAEDGDRFIPHTDEGFTLQYTTNKSNIINLGPVNGSNVWTFQLAGNAVGEATISFELMHNGHADFQSGLFQVHVIGLQP